MELNALSRLKIWNGTWIRNHPADRGHSRIPPKRNRSSARQFLENENYFIRLWCVARRSRACFGGRKENRFDCGPAQSSAGDARVSRRVDVAEKVPRHGF